MTTLIDERRVSHINCKTNGLAHAYNRQICRLISRFEQSINQPPVINRPPVNIKIAHHDQLLLRQIATLQLTVNAAGFISNASINTPVPTTLQSELLIGQEWTDIVEKTENDRAAAALINARAQPGHPVRADLTIKVGPQRTTPVSCWLCQASDSTDIAVAVIDLLPEVSLRKQLLNAQHAMERDYWSKRKLEARYRRLLDMVSEGFLVVDDASGRILEANPVAINLLIANDQPLVGRPFPIGFSSEEKPEIEQLVRDARSVSLTVEKTSSTSSGTSINVAITYLRQSGEGRLLIRLRDETDKGVPANETDYLIHASPDGIIELDRNGVVISANPAFLEMVEAANLGVIQGRRADQWIGRSAVDLNILLDHAHQETSVRLYTTILRTETQAVLEIEISVSQAGKQGKKNILLYIRDVSRRITSDTTVENHLPRSIDQITSRVGRVPLKELVRESTDVIEALCIEAALKLTNGNRASAAELLGLSRQSLYTKLRRFDLGEEDDVGDEG